MGGTGGGESGRYWLSAKDAEGDFELLVYDTQRKLWHRQDATEVAYVSNNRLYITNITVLGGIDVGQWSMEAAEGGLAFRWIGG